VGNSVPVFLLLVPFVLMFQFLLIFVGLFKIVNKSSICEVQEVNCVVRFIAVHCNSSLVVVSFIIPFRFLFFDSVPRFKC